MPDRTKASDKLHYTDDAVEDAKRERVVYVAGSEDDVGAELLEPLADRICNNSDFDRTEVRWRGSEWIEKNRQDFLTDITDLVLVLDDRQVQLLRDPKISADALNEASLNGRELLVVLRANEARSEEGRALARVWAAKAARIELIGLKRIAGREDWGLLKAEQDKRLHWLYGQGEKILSAEPMRIKDRDGVRTRLAGVDDDRLSERVGEFVNHQPGRCERCGRDHGADR